MARTGRLAKRAAALGLSKMHHHTAASTEWINCQGIADTLAAEAQRADFVLVDRAPIDAFAYYDAALEHRDERADPPEYERLRLLATTQHPTFALLLATVLDPDIPASATDGHPYDPATARWPTPTSTICSPKTTSTTYASPAPPPAPTPPSRGQSACA